MSKLPKLDPRDRRLNPPPGINREGKRARVTASFADLRAEPATDCPLDHQLLGGDAVTVYEEREGWALVQSAFDGYVGWTSDSSLFFNASEPTHVVHVPRTFAYPAPDLKLPVSRRISIAAGVTVMGETETRGTPYSILDTGEAIVSRHLRLVGEHDTDYIAAARKLIGTPYLWGGTTGFGVDCSGLVQLAMRMCGRMVLRDSDMQAATIGEEIDPGDDWSALRRGDLVFWRGHVGIVEGDGNFLHANGYTMDVASEPLSQAIGRIRQMFEDPIGCRRPPPGVVQGN